VGFNHFAVCLDPLVVQHDDGRIAAVMTVRV
jgi:hypothetical protein